MVFKHSLSKGGYYGKCSNIVESTSIKLKFDSGAVNTVIDAVYLGYKSNIKIIEGYLKSSNKFYKDFRSASGDSFRGYLCCSNNVLMGDLRLKNFYYFLSFIPVSITLLGDDFITYCGITHSIEGDFYINTFSQDRYDNYFNSMSNGNFVNSVDIAEICSAGLVAGELSHNVQTYGVDNICGI